MRSPKHHSYSCRFSEDLTARSVACLLLICVGGCGVALEPVLVEPAAVNVLNVNVIAAERDENALKTVVCFGKLTAARQSQLGFGRSGRVKTVYKQLGDRAAEGDELAEVEQTQLEDQKLKIEQAISQAKQDLQSSTGSRLASLQQQIQKLESQLKEVELELKNGVIVAPYPCLITERSIEAGTLVSPATPAFQIIEDAPPLVEASLPRAAAAQLKVDQLILVSIGNTEVVAKIRSRTPLQDPTGSQRILLEFAGELSARFLGLRSSGRNPTFESNREFWFLVAAVRVATQCERALVGARR